VLPAAAAAAFLLLGLAAGGGSAEVREREQRTLPVELRRLNKLANASLASRATGESLPLPQFLVISAATNTAPIEITTPIPHNLAAGDEVVIRGVVGNEAANGLWRVAPRTPTSFALDGSDGSGEYSGGGSVFPTVGQPIPQGIANARGDPPWSPWYSGPAAFEPTEFFRSDGSQPTGEVSTRPLLLVDQEPVLATSFLAQDIDGSRFRPGQPLCLSIEARIAGQPFDNQRLLLLAPPRPDLRRIGASDRIPQRSAAARSDRNDRLAASDVERGHGAGPLDGRGRADAPIPRLLLGPRRPERRAPGPGLERILLILPAGR
jgi:hypothetical protein